MRSSLDLAPREHEAEAASWPCGRRTTGWRSSSDEAQPVERGLVAQVDQAGEAAAAVDGEAVVAAIGLEARGRHSRRICAKASVIMMK